MDLDDHFEGALFGGVTERCISFEDLIELKAVRDKVLGIDPFRKNGLEQNGSADGIHEPSRNRDVSIPELLQMKVSFRAVDANIGYGSSS